MILVGDDPASQVYVRNKEKAAVEVGMRGQAHRLAATASEEDVRARIDQLNRDEAVDGFLVQLPLPAGMPETALLDRVAPSKDVDGLHPMNAGLLALGRAKIASATPRGVMRLIAEGYTAPEIGEQLSISPKTVDTYKQRINDKLGLAHRADYVKLALKLGLLQTPP